jgi:Leucine-rich repeat (LRR) protein
LGHRIRPHAPQTLHLTLNPISSLEGLRTLTNLTVLRLDSCGLTSKQIDPLRALTNLAALNLSNNNIDDFSPLLDLTKLVNLHIGGNPRYGTEVNTICSRTRCDVLH